MDTHSQRSEYHYRQAPSHEPEDRNMNAPMPDKGSTPENGPAVAKEDQPPVNTLYRSSLTIWVVCLYSALCIVSWAIIVYLTFYPIANSQLRYRRGFTGDYDPIGDDNADSQFAQNERWVQTARVLLSIAGVLSIPVASATCADAAPVYSQRRANSRDLSLRKVMMLADRCWANPLTYIQALRSEEGYRRYGSPFLILAILIHLLAFLVSPLQQIFLSETSVKRADDMELINGLFDIPSQFKTSYYQIPNNTVMLATRDSLRGASLFEPRSQLWTRGQGSISCALTVDKKCSPNIATFTNLSALHDPFLAELPSDYNTGLVSQFIPRINSSTKIVPAKFPGDCETTPGSLFFRHSHADSSNISYHSPVPDNYPWAVTVCMPASTTQSPWKPTRDRQDFTEELYVNVAYLPEDSEGSQVEYTVKIAVDTTAGYFELPNYFNGGKPGPLLPKQPECGLNCARQFDQYEVGIQTEEYKGLQLDAGKGPLRSIALALFGPDSFFTTWPRKAANHTLLQPYYSDNAPGLCIGLSPFGGLFMNPEGSLTARNISSPRFSSQINHPCGFSTMDTPNAAVQLFLNNFEQVSIERLENAFSAASFLANQAWMRYAAVPLYHNLDVRVNMGKDTQVPTISTAGIALVSIVLANYLAALFAVAIYATWAPRWTNQLDAFAMIRIGSALARDVPLLVSKDATQVAALDTLPGVMGDAMAEHEKPGKLWPGGMTPLR
ncbi:hypothetical protein PHISP_07999, partial [Aspergillus sp. HF37]